MRTWLAVLAVLAVVAAAIVWWALPDADADAAPPVTPGPTAEPTAATTPGADLPPLPFAFTATAEPGRVAASQRRPERPREITLPSGATVPVRAATTDADGVLEVPDDITLAGWWNGGARLGDGYGAIVIASHVDSISQGIGPFVELLEVTAGDPFTVTSTDLTQEFAVDTVDVVSRSSIDTPGDAFASDGANRLVLITCAGPFDPDDGGYQNLAIVTAVATGPAAPA